MTDNVSRQAQTSQLVLLRTVESYGCPINTATLSIYGQPIITATLLWSEQKLSQSFSYLKNPFNTARFLWPVGDSNLFQTVNQL